MILRRTLPAAVLLAVLVLGFGVILPGGDGAFLSLGNFRLILLQAVVPLLAGLGMLIIMTGRGADLGAGGLMAFVGAGAAALTGGGLPWWGALAVMIALGGAAGVFNGWALRLTGGSPLLLTLASGFVLWGAARLLPEAGALPEGGQLLMALFPPFPWPWFPPGVWLAWGVALGVWVMLRYTVWGHHLAAVGANEEAARLHGIPVGWTRWLAGLFAGLLFALAGGLHWAARGSPEVEAAPWLTLDALCVGLLAGAVPEGGRASVFGVCLGAGIVALWRNGVALAGGGREVADFGLALLLAGLLLFRSRGESM